MAKAPKAGALRRYVYREQSNAGQLSRKLTQRPIFLTAE